MLLGNAHVPQELGVNLLKRFVSLRPGFLDAISVPFAGLVVCGLFHVCTVTRGSRSAWDRKRKQHDRFLKCNL